MTGTREEIRIGQLAIRFLVEGEASGGSVAIFEFDVPAGAKVPIAHSHDAYEETIYGLEGVLTWTVEGRKIEVGKGDALCIPRGAVYRFDNLHAGEAKMLACGGHAWHPKARLLPRNRRCRQSRGRRPARPRGDRRGDAAPRPHAGAVTRAVVGQVLVRVGSGSALRADRGIEDTGSLCRATRRRYSRRSHPDASTNFPRSPSRRLRRRSAARAIANSGHKPGRAFPTAPGRTRETAVRLGLRPSRCETRRWSADPREEF